MGGSLMRGFSITYAEIDGVPVCIVDGRFCEREACHDGVHVFRPEGNDEP
jgi:hypothetical protein